VRPHLISINHQPSTINFSNQLLNFYVNLNSMANKISEGVEIEVETFINPTTVIRCRGAHVCPTGITIWNHNNFSVKLHRRQWHIFDSNGSHREVEGEGVVGVQPILQPGEKYQYVSGCNLHTEMGKMYGSYNMENRIQKISSKVNIRCLR